jgi:hypothetical protein
MTDRDEGYELDYAEDTGWDPPEDLPTHAGHPLPDNMDLFVEPPPEIGEVTSAYSTLRFGKQPWSPVVRALLMTVGALLGLGLGLVIGVAAEIQNVFWILLWPLVLGAVGVGVFWVCTNFTHTVTYVGREGVARFVCWGTRHRITTEEVFPFREATELRTTQVRRYVNGVYQGTDYTYSWTDVGGRQRYRIAGTHRSEKGKPGPADQYHYATSSEMAWSLYLLDGAALQMQTKGEIRFNLDRGNWVSVGQGYLRLCVRGETIDCDTQDIASVSINQGVFKVKRVDAKEGWFSSKGVFTFNYNALANAQLFLFVLDKLAGVQIR